jgi:hypothetical protein
MRRVFVAGTLMMLGSSVYADPDFLYSRAGGQAYYDWRQDITWLADANYAQTSNYDPDGHLTHADAGVFIASLNNFSLLGQNTWRFPQWIDLGIGWKWCGGDRGSNVDTRSGEMAFLFYDILRLDADLDCAGGAVEPHGLNTYAGAGAPFINIEDARDEAYWYEQLFDPDPSRAWVLHFEYGAQHADGTTSPEPVWPVLDGDPLYVAGDELPDDIQITVEPFDPTATGQVEVIILSYSTWNGAPFQFEPTDVDLSQVRFGPDRAMPNGSPVFEDVNGDLLNDLRTQFDIQETGFVCEDTEGTLYGDTYADDDFASLVSMAYVGCDGGGGCHP